MKKTPLFLLLIILPIIAIGKSFERVAWQITLGYLLLISLTTFAIYWHDKRQAQSNGWRVPEKTLHLLELLGGWLAAYIAQQRLRHKTSKRRYQIVFWLIVAAHQFAAMDYLLKWGIVGSAFGR